MATKEYNFKIGDPVWAKMKGFSAWPGKVDMPPDYLKRPTIKKVMHCVFFFGTYDYGWIPEHDLKPYQEFKDKMMSSKKSVKKAVDEIEEYIAGGCKTPSNQIVASGAATKPTPVKTKTPSKKEKSANNTSSADDEADADFDALFSETKTPVSNSKKTQQIRR